MCKECGIDELRVLEIDHIDPSKKIRPKKLQYSTVRRLALWKKEMGNIQLLCANCHRLKTHKETWKTEEYYEIAKARIDAVEDTLF